MKHVPRQNDKNRILTTFEPSLLYACVFGSQVSTSSVTIFEIKPVRRILIIYAFALKIFDIGLQTRLKTLLICTRAHGECSGPRVLSDSDFFQNAMSLT